MFILDASTKLPGEMPVLIMQANGLSRNVVMQDLTSFLTRAACDADSKIRLMSASIINGH